MSERIIDAAVYPNEARVQALRLRDQRDRLREALREIRSLEVSHRTVGTAQAIAAAALGDTPDE
jgi:hypothetical protein